MRRPPAGTAVAGFAVGVVAGIVAAEDSPAARPAHKPGVGILLQPGVELRTASLGTAVGHHTSALADNQLAGHMDTSTGRHNHSTLA